MQSLLIKKVSKIQKLDTKVQNLATIFASEINYLNHLQNTFCSWFTNLNEELIIDENMREGEFRLS